MCREGVRELVLGQRISSTSHQARPLRKLLPFVSSTSKFSASLILF